MSSKKVVILLATSVLAAVILACGLPSTERPPLPTQPSQPALEYWLDPNFGTVDLSTGFWPDPYEVDVVSGGTVDVNTLNLGEECRGYATSAPDFRLNLSGDSSRVRIFFVSDNPVDDATLIVNDAAAGWRCNGDSSGTLNPMVEMQNPSNGQYDIWIGSYRSGEYIGGTLYITEFDLDPSDY